MFCERCHAIKYNNLAVVPQESWRECGGWWVVHGCRGGSWDQLSSSIVSGLVEWGGCQYLLWRKRIFGQMKGCAKSPSRFGCSSPILPLQGSYSEQLASSGSCHDSQSQRAYDTCLIWCSLNSLHACLHVLARTIWQEMNDHLDIIPHFDTGRLSSWIVIES